MIKIVQSPEAQCWKCQKEDLLVFQIPNGGYALVYLCLKCLQQAFFEHLKSKKRGGRRE